MAGAAFCMHCGQPFASQQHVQHAPAAAPTYALPVAGDYRRRNTVLAIVISAAILAALLVGLRAAGVLRFGATSPDDRNLQATGQQPDLNSLEASGSNPQSVLQSRGSGSTPTLESSQATMPGPVRNWLNHLERMEMKKRTLAKDQESEVTDMIGDLKGAGGLTVDDVQALSDPDSNTLPMIDKVASIMRRLQPAWEGLRREFNSVPPPQECRAIAEAFDQGLADIPAKMRDLDALVSGVSGGVDQDTAKGAREGARELARGHRQTIDEPFAQTDRLVGQVCDKYQTRKWFSIDAHGGGRGLLGF